MSAGLLLIGIGVSLSENLLMLRGLGDGPASSNSRWNELFVS